MTIYAIFIIICINQNPEGDNPMEEKVFEGLKYLVCYPKDFSKDKKHPLVLFLHGAGTRSDVTDKLRNGTSLTNIQKHQDERGYIIVAPLCPEESNWNEQMAVLIRLTETYRELPYIDKQRIHVTGKSMGGYGTWAICTLKPHWFASAMPLCGGGIGGFASSLVDVPIRAFHGLRDTAVDPIESLQMAKAVNLAGGHAELILFAELTHNCWTTVYSDEKNLDWLLSFKKESK